MIKKVLIANRGEIAVRVMRTCREMGIKTVAVYSEADRKSLHVRYADEAYFIGASPSSESYLVIDKILEAAKKSRADAIHPGYGFLSENAEFAKQCRKQGITFIGPSSHAISLMGDKITARKIAMESKVPVVPGTSSSITSDTEINKIAAGIGFPLMIKASAGGGGKGIRLVHSENELANSVRAAKSEAMSSFGDDSVYIEKYITSPHHIEIQILADRYGNAVHLFERECSVQRRHQKIIEESPSPLITNELRMKMGEAAVKLAKSVEYEGAGTVEFLVDDELNFYFLEMNTRLQVEHPITERVVGIDLVKQQLKIASGEKLSITQEQLRQQGHAIECRIYAEDPFNNFMPNPGIVRHISEPTGLGIRTDGYVYEGFEIPIFYDPMISKLIVWGFTREDAINRMNRALYEYKITGVKTSIPFLVNILNNSSFRKGKYNTHLIQDNIDSLSKPPIDCDTFCEDISIITAFIEYTSRLEKNNEQSGNENSKDDWRNFGRRKGVLKL